MSYESWKAEVLAKPGARQNIDAAKREIRLAMLLRSMREDAKLTQRQLAEKMGIKQSRIAKIERAEDMTLNVIDRYITALGGDLELTVVRDGVKTSLLGVA